MRWLQSHDVHTKLIRGRVRVQVFACGEYHTDETVIMSDIISQRFMGSLHDLSSCQREEYVTIKQFIRHTMYGLPACVAENEDVLKGIPCSLRRSRDRRRPISPPIEKT